MRNPLKRKKQKVEKIPQETLTQNYQAAHKGKELKVVHVDMPITAPRLTFNFGDILRYFKYNMSSGIMIATIERAVQRELQNRKDFPTKFVFGAIAVGIMIFMIFMGAVVLLQVLPTAGEAAASAAPPTIYG